MLILYGYPCRNSGTKSEKPENPGRTVLKRFQYRFFALWAAKGHKNRPPTGSAQRKKCENPPAEPPQGGKTSVIHSASHRNPPAGMVRPEALTFFPLHRSVKPPLSPGSAG